MAKEKLDVYEIVNQKVIELLEKGIVPWFKPWTGQEQPANLISKKKYRGLNTMLLGCQPFARQYWLTFNQCNALGGRIKKGEKSTIVIFWKFLDVQDKDDSTKTKSIPMLRYYRVFNIEQCEGLPEKKIPATKEGTTIDFHPIEECEKIANGYNQVSIVNKTQSAYYNPSEDYINMPRKETFVNEEEYYSTLFHEMVHSTGHTSRLNRIQAKAAFGSGTYSKEELVAEYGAAYICTLIGIENKTIDNSAAYINNWLHALKNDKRLLVTSCGAAQKAVDYILNEGEENDNDN